MHFRLTPSIFTYFGVAASHSIFYLDVLLERNISIYKREVLIHSEQRGIKEVSEVYRT